MKKLNPMNIPIPLIAISLVLFGCADSVNFNGQSGTKGTNAYVINKTFYSTEVGEKNLILDRYHLEVLALSNPKGPIEENFRIELPATATKVFPLPFKNKVENFQQKDSNAKLDLVVVIDNSSSMIEEQENMSNRLGKLLESVTESDWRIAVITTDDKHACHELLTKEQFVADPAGTMSRFKNAIEVGTRGSHVEKGFLQAVKALQSCRDSSWVRADSAVAVLIVSDEDNCSHWEQPNAICIGKDYLEPAYLLNHLTGPMGRKLKENARVYGIIYRPFDPCRDIAMNQGRRYLEAINASGGTSGMICEADYSNTLSQISEDIASILIANYNLAASPIGGSLKVFVNNVLIGASAYQVEGKKIIFNTPPAPSASIRVEYDYTDSEVKNFVIAEIAQRAQASIVLDGSNVAATSYSYDPSSGTISFNIAPIGKELKVIAGASKANYKRFSLKREALPESLVVTLNDSTLSSSEYVYVNSEKSIEPVANFETAANLRVKYLPVPKPQLRYALKVPADSLDTMVVKDKGTGIGVLYKYEDNELIFAEADVIDGRQIDVIWEKKDFDPRIVTLDPPLASERGPAVQGDKTGACPEASIKVVDSKTIDISACGSMDDDKIVITYPYTILVKEFLIDEERIGQYRVATWKVLVNGESREDYKIEDGNRLTFAEIEPEAVINVRIDLQQ